MDSSELLVFPNIFAVKACVWKAVNKYDLADLRKHYLFSVLGKESVKKRKSGELHCVPLKDGKTYISLDTGER